MMSKVIKILLGEQNEKESKEDVAPRKKTAHLAKERLQVIITHERGGRTGKIPDYLPALREDLLKTILRHVEIKPEDMKLNVERQGTLEVLELKIDLPES